MDDEEPLNPFEIPSQLPQLENLSGSPSVDQQQENFKQSRLHTWALFSFIILFVLYFTQSKNPQDSLDIKSETALPTSLLNIDQVQPSSAPISFKTTASSMPVQSSSPRAIRTLVDVVQGKTLALFGDTIIHGEHMAQENFFWKDKHPPTIKLQSLLNDTSIIELGSDDKTTTQVLSTFLEQFNEVETVAVVVIWSGIYDLSKKLSVKKTLKNIIEMHRLAHEKLTQSQQQYQVFTVAITIPQLNLPFRKDNRQELNDGIRNFARRCRLTALLDIESFHNPSQAANEKYWSADLVHLSPLGYDEIGSKIFQAMSKFTVDLHKNKTCSY